jgi:hypothetical protein
MKKLALALLFVCAAFGQIQSTTEVLDAAHKAPSKTASASKKAGKAKVASPKAARAPQHQTGRAPRHK